MKTLAVVITCLMFAAGCGATTSTSSAPAEPVTIEITLRDGAADPVGATVDLTVGQEFTLDVTSDRDDEIHVHGFDTTIDVAEGQHVSHTFTAEQSGSFEVESHDPVITILRLQIR